MSRVKNQKTKPTLLTLLAKNSEFELSKMKTATGLSYPTILKAIHELEKEKIVKCVRLEPSEKGGKEKKIYALTNGGLFLALQQERVWSDRELFKQIRNAQVEKMSLFKKWHLFAQAGLEEALILEMQQALLDLRDVYQLVWKRKTMPIEEHVLTRIEHDVFLSVLISSSWQQAFMNVCKNDTELSSLVTDLIAFHEESLRKGLAVLEKLKSAWVFSKRL